MVEIVPIGGSAESQHGRDAAFAEIERFRQAFGRSTREENRQDIEQGRL